MRKQLLLLGALALTLGTAMRVFKEPLPAVAGAASAAAAEDLLLEDDRPHWETVWTHRAPDLVAMDLASGGEVAWVDRKGCVRGMDVRGRTRLQTAPLAGVNCLVATPPGLVLAYSRLNPLRPVVTILDPKDGGKRPLACPVEGAVWRVAVSFLGNTALVGTGQRWVYVLPVDRDAQKTARPVARWRAPGIPESAALVSERPLALLGTWQRSGVSAFSLDGTPRPLQYEDPESDRAHSVCLSADGSTAVATSARGPREAEARVTVWDTENGRRLWSENLEAFRPDALTSHNGQLIAVAYVKALSYRTGAAVERKLALFDRTGQRLWEKGKLFFSPRLVAFAADGSRLTVTDGAGAIYTLDARGRFQSKLRLPANPSTGVVPGIRQVIASEDGEWLLIHRGDGQITLLRAT